MPKLPRDTVRFQISPPQRPEDGRFHAMLAAHDQVLRLAHLRESLLSVLAALSSVVWAVAVRPQLFGARLRFLVLYGWACVAIVVLVVSLRQWWWKRARDTHLRALNPPRKE